MKQETTAIFLREADRKRTFTGKLLRYHKQQNLRRVHRFCNPKGWQIARSDLNPLGNHVTNYCMIPIILLNLFRFY